MIAAHVAVRTARDALFLSQYDVTDLPKVMIGAALVSITSALVLSRALTRHGPTRAVPVALGLSAVLLVVEWGVVTRAPRIGAVIVYLHAAAFGGVLISGFWSVVNERFDPHEGKRTIVRIGAMAALGAVVGGVAASRLSAQLGLPVLLLAVSGLHVASAIGVRGIGVSRSVRSAAAPTTASFASGFGILRRTPYLQQMAGLVALCALTDALLDYALKSEAAARFADGASLAQFFAAFYTLAGLLAFGLQISAGSRVLQKFGLGGAMAALPGVIVVAGAVTAAVPRLASVVVLRGLAAVTANSLFRSGFELLYTPVAPATKRPTKVFVDVGASRLGDLLGAGFILILVAGLPAVPTRLLAMFAVAAAAGGLLALRTLQQGYVQQLAGSLRSGLLALKEEEVVDATTARTVAATQVFLDRHAILSEIRGRQPESAADAPAPGVAGRDPSRTDIGEILARDATLRRLVDLHSDDPERIRQALCGENDDPRLVATATELLARDDVSDDALAFLCRTAPRAIGQLLDALLDRSRPLVVRRRIPRVLEVCDDPRAVEGLHRALRFDPRERSGSRVPDEFEVRVQCAQTAARIVARNPELALTGEQVHDIALRELAVDSVAWERQGRRRADVRQNSVLIDGPSMARINRSVEHVFTVLSLALEREVMASTLGGLYTDDEGLRGTALEYLEVSLPKAVSAGLLPRLERPQRRPRSDRPAAEMAEELIRSSASIVISRDTLRRG